MKAKYDSRVSTRAHIAQVRDLLGGICCELRKRGSEHDATKLKGEERKMCDQVTPLLCDSTYGSEEYNALLAKMDPVLRKHYARNRHHPEHFPFGMTDMTLLDLMEMLADWKAATLRHTDGNLQRSFVINKVRFRMSREMTDMLENTAKELGWM